MLDTKRMCNNAPNKSADHLENFNEDEYPEKLQSILNNIAMPDGFDTWTVEKQRDWAYQNLIKYFPNVPETLQNTMLGVVRLINFDQSQKELPEWVEIDKYHKGQKFVRKHYFSIILATLIGAIYSYTFEDGLKPIIIGGNSHTPYLAFKRYLNTIKRMLAWYDGEPWVKNTKAYRDMQIVCKKHLTISTKVSGLDNKQYHAASKFEQPWCPEYETLLKDFALTCPFEKLGQRPYKVLDTTATPCIPKGLNNATMAVAQANFMMLPILYPQNIGIHGVTDEDLEAFCHMWKCYGYFLGVENEFNFCRGSLEEIKQRLRDLTQHWTIVNFKEIEPEFVHVTKCMIESMSYYSFYFPYKTIILLLTETLNLNMPNLYASLSYTEWITYMIYRFVFHHASKISIVRSAINRAMYKILEATSNFDSKKLAELHEKSKRQLPDFSINL